MSINVKDTKTAEKAIVRNVATNEIQKVVNFHNTEIGTENVNKDLTVYGNIIGNLAGSNGVSKIVAGPGVSIVTQSNGQIYVSNDSVAHPASLPGLQLWFESFEEHMTFNTSFVPRRIERWKDLSDNGNHLVQTNASLQPRWFANNFNLGPAGQSMTSADFQSGQVMTTVKPVNLTTFSIIIGTHLKSTGGNLIYEHSTDVNSNDGSWICTSHNALGGASFLAKRGGVFSSKDLPYGASWATQNGWPIVLTHQFGGAHNLHRFSISNWDAQLTADASANNLSATTAVNLTLSLGARASGVGPISGSIYFFAAYSPALSPNDAAKVARYVGTRWNVHVM